MFNDHKLQGIGMNNFTYLCKNDDRYKNLIKIMTVLAIPIIFIYSGLVETGIFGLIFFLVYLYFVILHIYQ